MYLRRRVDGPVQPWAGLVVYPVLLIDVGAPPEVALAAAERGLRHGRFRTRTAPGRVEGRRINWDVNADSGIPLPTFERQRVLIEVVPDQATQLRFTQPMGKDLGSARRAGRSLSAAVTELRAAGVAVTVHEWDDLDPWNSERRAKKRRRRD